MVCRENKARSALMGYTKRCLANAGVSSYCDHEVQSLLHQESHRYSEFPMPTKEEYLFFLKGVRQQIVNDPSISDGDKYRPSTGRAGQPGLVTRLDEEMERFRTGKNPDGTPLTTAQMNVGGNFAAMTRLVQPLVEQQESKAAYCDLYARHMGISRKQAEERFTRLIDRPASERDNTHISLTDGWQEKLAVAGISTHQQATMGQSNRIREAIRLMEAERQTKIRSLPTRPAFTPETAVRFVTPAEVAGKEQCLGGCGQFGHTLPECPHKALVDKIADAEQRINTLDPQRRAINDAVTAKTLLSRINDGDLAEGAEVQFRGETRRVGDPALTADLDQHAAAVPTDAQTRKVMRALKQAKADALDARASLDAVSGPQPMVSSYVRSFNYNRETGAAVVEVQPYQRKDGTVAPPKKYLRRMSPDEYDQMMASDDPGRYVQNHLFARVQQQANASDRYHFSNPDEAREATVQRRCPTCGEWASFGTAHKCPTEGDVDTADTYVSGNQRAANRERAELLKLPAPPISEQKPRHRVLGVAAMVTADNGHIRMGDPREADQIVDRGGVAIGKLRASYLGATVQGETFLWTDPSSGKRLARTAKMKCSCGQSECRHVEMAASAFTVQNRAVTSTVSPGMPDVTGAASTATGVHNTAIDPDQKSFARHMKDREAYAAKIAAYRPTTTNPARLMSRSATLNGKPVRDSQLPSTYTHPVGDHTQPINLDDPAEVGRVLADRLNKESGGGWVTRVDTSGGIWLQDRSAATSITKQSSKRALQSMAAVFGRDRRNTRADVYIPAMRSWRIEMLDRASGHQSGVQGARYTTVPSE